MFNTDSSYAYYSIIVCIGYTMLSWVRNLAKFSFTFLVGIVMALITSIYILSYASIRISEDGKGPNLMLLNSEGYITTLGISIYCYEGIGSVMPVMAACEKPERLKEMIVYVFLTLGSFYLMFAQVCYFAWGSDLTEPLATQMLPADSVAVIIVKLIYAL